MSGVWTREATVFDSIRNTALRVLKVPPEPQAPVGDPASLRVFRAGRNFYRLRLVEWAFAEVIALFVLLFWTAVLIDVEMTARARRAELAAQAPAEAAGSEGSGNAPVSKTEPASGEPAQLSDGERVQPEPQSMPERFVATIRAAAEMITHKAETEAPRSIAQWITTVKRFLVELALRLPEWTFPLVWVVKIGSFVIYLVQIPITYGVRRLDYEMRWYMVTDRSLRLRYGAWRVTESTMSFANIQQVAVSQGPLQRLLGLADVKVQSAGGGGGAAKEGKASDDDDMHLGLFRHVTNATEIRDLILDRLRHFRQTGLGDPDERAASAASAPPTPTPRPTTGAVGDTLAAAQELLAEARALRKVV